MPHVNYLSHAEYVDEAHVALTYQFFNRSRAQRAGHRSRGAGGGRPEQRRRRDAALRYLRTETEGPVFERLRAKLAGIAAHTGMEKVFHLRGADIYRVEGLRQRDPRHSLPCTGAALRPRQRRAPAVRRAWPRRPTRTACCASSSTGCSATCASTTPSSGCWTRCARACTAWAACGYDQPGTGAEMPLATVRAGRRGRARRGADPHRPHVVDVRLRADVARQRGAAGAGRRAGAHHPPARTGAAAQPAGRAAARARAHRGRPAGGERPRPVLRLRRRRCIGRRGLGVCTRPGDAACRRAPGGPGRARSLSPCPQPQRATAARTPLPA